MGRYAEPLADVFVAFAGVGVGDKVLDVGCGPGALTAHLLSVGAEVAAIDPSPPFIDAIRVRFPDVDVRRGVVTVHQEHARVREIVDVEKLSTRCPCPPNHNFPLAGDLRVVELT